MVTVYIDQVFFLNALVDYLLLLCTAKLAGEELRRGAFALAAALGGLYAALTFLPGWGFLGYPLCILAAGVGMALIAYGRSRHLLRVSLTFLGAAAAFSGGVLALQRFAGAPAVPDLKTVCLSAAACYAFLTLIFRRGTRHSGELAPVTLILEGRTCRLTALTDTGNTLTDPATGRPVIVAEGDRLAALFPPGECPGREELEDPAAALLKRRYSRWRLVPYRAVGVDRGLLLAVRVDRALVGNEDYGPVLVALSPTPVSDGGGYFALIGV